MAKVPSRTLDVTVTRTQVQQFKVNLLSHLNENKFFPPQKKIVFVFLEVALTKLLFLGFNAVRSWFDLQQQINVIDEVDIKRKPTH